MPIPQLFAWSPRPDQTQDQTPHRTPASESPSRFGALHHNVRSIINGSSIYSQSPNPNASHANTPKLPFLGFLRREQSPRPIHVSDDMPRESSDSRSPLRPQHTAGSYMRAIAPLEDPRRAERMYAGETTDQNRHPADVRLEYDISGAADPVTEQLRDEIHSEQHRHRQHRRKRRKHRQHHDQHRRGHWVRRHNDRTKCMPFSRRSATRGKVFACVISGFLLATVLATYLALALSHKDLGQEIHVLFIMITLATTIFFCHSLIRLCMLLLHPASAASRNTRGRRNQRGLPEMNGSDGFRPIKPIRVHLARDEELDDQPYDEEREISGAGAANGAHAAAEEEPKEKPVAMPPPAYGLWRSSVRVDPDLLHWQRVENVARRNSIGASGGRGDGPPVIPLPAGLTPNLDDNEGIRSNTTVPRPPSYISDDGVSYVVEAVARSTAPAPTHVPVHGFPAAAARRQSHSGISDIHPAWRPGFDVESPTHVAGRDGNEWPGPWR